MTSPNVTIDTVLPNESLPDFLGRRKAALDADVRRPLTGIKTDLPGATTDLLITACLQLAETGFDIGAESVILYASQQKPK